MKLTQQNFLNVIFELLGRDIAPLDFKTKRVAEPALRSGDFDKLQVDFPELGGYFPVPWTLI